MARTGARMLKEAVQKCDTDKVTLRKGRNADMIAQRNELLIYRWVYYAVHTSLRQDTINARLALEFHLTETRFLEIVYNRAKEIKLLKSNPPNISELKKKYPHFNWSL